VKKEHLVGGAGAVVSLTVGFTNPSLTNKITLSGDKKLTGGARGGGAKGRKRDE